MATSTSAASPDAPHRYPVTVYIGDTDAYRMMYHTNYLVYYGRARLAFLGLPALAALFGSAEGVSVRDRRVLHIRYFDSARLGEECAVVTTLFGVDEAAGTITFNHAFNQGADGSGKTLNRAVVEVGFARRDGSAVAPGFPPALGFDPAAPGLARCTSPRVFGGSPLRCPAVVPAAVRQHTMALGGYADLCDASGRLQLHALLDCFERARSAGMGGPVTLQRCVEESGHIFVVGRMDHVYCCAAAPPVFGDELEIRTSVELKHRNVCIVFHHQLWRTGRIAAAGAAGGAGGAEGGSGGGAAAAAADEAVPLVEAAVSVYSISEKDKSPVPAPAWLEKMIAPFMLKR